eukprot:tig00020563_g11378.t1
MPVGLAELLVCEGVAVATTGLFAGTALSINVVGQPAKKSLDAATAVRLWRDEFWRVAKMQLGFAVVGSAAAIAAWAIAGNKRMLVAGLSLGSVVPWTVGVMRPTTLKPLLDTAQELSEAEARRLLALWNNQHAVRTAASLVALGFAISAVQRGQARLDAELWSDLKREFSSGARGAAGAAAGAAHAAVSAAATGVKSRV